MGNKTWKEELEEERKKLIGRDLIGIMLSSTLENCDRNICENLSRQIQIILGENREHPLIKRFYHFATGGAFPYSEEVEIDWQILLQSYSINHVLPSGGTIIDNFKNYGRTEYTTREDLSNEDYEFLRELGRKIEVKERYKRTD